MTELERLEAELAARTAPAQPVKPAIKPDDEAEARRIEAAERRRCAQLQRQLAQQKMLDGMAMRQAAERRERRDWLDDNPHWRND